MFDWIGDLIDAIAEAIREAFEFLGTQISNTIWNTMAPDGFTKPSTMPLPTSSR